MTGDHPAGLLLLTVAATRLALRTLTGHADHTIVCPWPQDGPAATEIALRTPLDPAAPAADFLDALHTDLTAAAPRAWAHRAALAQRLDAIGSADGAALSQIAVVWAGTPSGGVTTTADLVVLADRPEPDGGIRIRVQAPVRPARAATASLARCTAAALTAIAAQPRRPAGELDTLGDEHRAELLAWSGLPVPASFPSRTLPEVLASAARTAPGQPALADAGGGLTHGELQDLATQAAAQLSAAHGIGRGDRVALLVPGGRPLVTAMLAVLATGACCVPLDPSHPASRISLLTSLAGAKLTICGQQRPDGLDPAAATVTLASLLDAPAPAPADPAPAGPGPGDPAIMFFTSGSTGRPRAVTCRHDQLAHKALSTAALLGIDSATRCALLSAITSDATAYQVLTVLAAGGCLVWTGRVNEVDPLTFWHRLRAHQVNMINCVPAVLAAMAGALPPGETFRLRHLILGGEAVPAGLLRRTAGRLSTQTFANLYGPCEATIEASTFHCDGATAATLHTVPIGQPSPGYGVLLLNDDGDMVPPGVAGEIVIVGPGVTGGYDADPQATAQRFVTCPLAGGAPAFRTGDFARWLPGGQLGFIGRRDDQVQVNGYRVELGEVEAAMTAVPGVREAGVAPVQDDLGGTSLVAGYSSGGQVPPDALRAALSRALPGYLVPLQLTELGQLPRSPHGKLDRAALATQAAATDGPGWEPDGPAERLVAQAWQAALGRAPRSADEDFFASGGQSLAAARLVAELCERTDAESLAIADVFAARTPAALVAAIRVPAAGPRPSTAGPAPAPRAPAPGPSAGPASGATAPASNAQRRMWLLDRLDEGQVRSYNMVEGYRLPRDITAPALRRAMAALVARHEALRTTFTEAGGELLQVIAPPGELPDVVTVRPVAAGELDTAVAEQAETEFRHPLDPAAGPLLRVVFLTAPDADPVLLFNVHHLICDGWSFAVILRDLLDLAAGRTLGRPAMPYREHSAALAARLAGDYGASAARYWRGVLASPPEPVMLPTDRRRPPVRTDAGGLVRVPLGPAATRGLAELSRLAAATPFMVLTAATRVLLFRLTGSRDVLLGTVVAGRGTPAVAGSVGLFVNTIVLRTPLDPDASFRDLVDAVRGTALESAGHQEYPFDLVVDELAPQRDPGRNAIFDVFVETVISGTGPEGRATGRPVVQLDIDPPVSTFDLSFSFREPGPGHDAEVWVGYSSALYDPGTAARTGAQFRTLLEHLLDAPDLPAGRAPLLPADQRRFLLEDCNDTRAPFPAGQTLLDLVQAQVTTRPRQPAVHCGDVTLSFAGLDERAGWVASALRAQAAPGPGQLVAVVLRRTEWMVVALLGILKTGAAFLPLDPDQPAGRLADLLRAARPVAVLADGPYLAAVSATAGVPVLDPAACPAGPGPAPEPAGAPRATPSDLAYVIFTSGSTGVPKGVMVEHRGIVNTIHYRAGYYDFGPDACVLQVPPIHFDSGVNDVFSALIAGTAVTVAGREELLDPDRVAALVQRYQISHIMLVPSLYQLLLERNAGALTSVRQIVLVGERLPEALAARHARLLPGTVLYNEYGPTEDSVWTTVHRITDPSADILIGHPIANKAVDLLDERDELVPLGVPGQLCISGVGVARGYLNDPELTSQKFTPHPQRPGLRMYRTGDLARRTAAGTLQYLGRADDQVKIRGQRVEPGEVAAVLGDAPGVRQCAVVARPDARGDLRLVAYVAGAATPEQLWHYLAARLPQAMVPAVYVPLDALPVNSNGKLDRSALPPPPEPDPGSATPGTAPPANGQPEAGQLEPGQSGTAPSGAPAATGLDDAPGRLARIWAQVLQRSVPDVDAGLFELGGHSLSAARIAGEVNREFGLEIPLRAVFQYQTIRQFTGYLEQAHDLGQAHGPGQAHDLGQAHGPGQAQPSASPVPAGASPAPANPRAAGTAPDGADLVPLSAAQYRILLASRAAPATTFNLADAVTVPGGLDPGLLRTALAAVVYRHELLRAVVVFPPGRRPGLRIHDALPDGPPLEVIDADPAATDPDPLTTLIAAARETAFDLAQPPLLRVRLIRGLPGGDVLVVIAHHLIYDGASVHDLFGDTFTAYERLRAGGPPGLEPDPAGYPGWVATEQAWLGTEAADRDRAYWRDRLAGAPAPLDVTGGRPRASRRTTDFAVLRHEFGPAGYAGLRAAATRQAATPFMALCTAFAAVLHGITGDTDLILGFPSTSADHPPVVGVYTNSVALRLDLEAAPTHAHLLDQVRDRVLEAYQHARLPFGVVVEQSGARQYPGRGELFDVGVSWETAAAAAPGHRGPITFDPIPQRVRAQSDLWIYAREQPGGLLLELAYDPGLLSPDVARELLARLLAALARTGSPEALPADGPPETLAADAPPKTPAANTPPQTPPANTPPTTPAADGSPEALPANTPPQTPPTDAPPKTLPADGPQAAANSQAAGRLEATRYDF